MDLAGSERIAATGAGASALLLKQSISVNKSLFVLRKVIQALAGVSADGGASSSTVVAGQSCSPVFSFLFLCSFFFFFFLREIIRKTKTKRKKKCLKL